MGFIKWIARWGNVGGTARWASKRYKFFRSRHPDTVIYRLMIVTRYEKLPNQEVEEFLLSISSNLNGLRDLVVEILDQEAGFTENEEDIQQMFLSVIENELEKKGLTDDIIYDES